MTMSLLLSNGRLYFIQPGNAVIEPQVDFELETRHGVNAISYL